MISKKNVPEKHASGSQKSARVEIRKAREPKSEKRASGNRKSARA